MLAKLRGIQGGNITLIDGETRSELGDRSADLHATIRVHDLRFYRAVAFGGSIGAGESYRDGYWSCSDLVALIQIFARNMQASSDLGGFWNTLQNIGRKFAHRVNRNSRAGAAATLLRITILATISTRCSWTTR